MGADLLAMLGDGDDDYWWEESLTRDIVAETENTSDWDALAQEQKRIKDEMLKRQEEERNELQSQILAEENMLVEELKLADDEKIKQRAIELDGLSEQQIKDANLETVQELRERLERERESEKQRIKEGMHQKLKKEMNKLKLKQQLEILKEEADQAREKEKMQMKKAPEIERKVLKRLLESGKFLHECLEKQFSRPFLHDTTVKWKI